jgi:hypothetical protein
VRKAFLKFASYDEYVGSGNQAIGLDVVTADMAAVEKRLESVVKRWVQAMGGELFDIILDLGALQGRSTVGVENAGTSTCIQ